MHMDRVPREMASRLVAVAALPALIAFLFGVTQFARLAVEAQFDPHQQRLTRLEALANATVKWNENWYDTYAMVAGSLIAFACLGAYARLLRSDAPRTGIKHGLLAAARFGAFAFAIYLLGIAGAFRLFRILYPLGFSWYRLLAGSLWIVLGYMMLHRLWILSEVVEAVREDRAVVSDDSESVGIASSAGRRRG